MSHYAFLIGIRYMVKVMCIVGWDKLTKKIWTPSISTENCIENYPKNSDGYSKGWLSQIWPEVDWSKSLLPTPDFLDKISFQAIIDLPECF